MPKGLNRFYGNGDLHFITASCYRRMPLLGTPHRRDLFVKVLEQVRQRYEFAVVGYVVIQALKLGVARGLFPTCPKTGEKWGTPWFW